MSELQKSIEPPRRPVLIGNPMTATKLAMVTSSGIAEIQFDRPLKLKAGDRVHLPSTLAIDSEVRVTGEDGQEIETRRHQDGAYRFVVDGRTVDAPLAIESSEQSDAGDELRRTASIFGCNIVERVAAQQLFRCRRCGALTDYDGLADHDAWHDNHA